MYSQNSEEGVILDYFNGKTDGTLLDIGAFGAEALSNTRQLILNGWKGVLIEPSPLPFNSLLTAYRDNPKIELIAAAISAEPVVHGLVPWYDSAGDAVSTASERHRELWSKDVKYRKYYLPVVHINAVYNITGQRHFDFINLDVEGMNFEILKTLDLSECQCICVEFEDKITAIMDYLVSHGFEHLHTTSENVIFGKPARNLINRVEES